MGEERAKKLQERLNQKRLEREAQEKKGRPGSQPNERRLETAGDAEASGAEETGEAGRQAGQRASEEADRTGPPREEGRATEGGRSQEVPGECHDDGHLTERNPAGSIQTWSNRNQNTVCTDGTKLVQTFKASEQLSAVRLFTMLNRKDQHDPTAQCGFSCAYPRKVYKDEDFDKQLRDLGLTPSAALHVTKSM